MQRFELQNCLRKKSFYQFGLIFRQILCVSHCGNIIKLIDGLAYVFPELMW